MTTSISLFVDAGYLFKQGSAAALGRIRGRHELDFDAGVFVVDLTNWLCQQFPSDELFRTYWYDGAKRGVAVPEQLSIAALPYVKFRLGRINSSGQQKGVDTLIVRDLMVLSQERSINRAVVLSGDEDLREGIEYAQDRGVRVAVLGIKAPAGSNQSVELIREADESLLVPPDLLKRSLKLKPQSAAVRLPLTVTDPSSLTDAARAFAANWTEKANADELTALVAVKPSLPRSLDSQLLKSVVEECGIQRSLETEELKSVRTAFWTAIEKETTS